MTRALFQSLIDGPLLIGDLPEASSFPYRDLCLPAEFSELNPNQKLGHLYEDALAALLEASSGVEILAQNLQLQRNIHDTVGELDFLLRDLSSGELIHLELATKFYLAVGDELPGPDARDNYARKLARLRSHQLPLAMNYREFLPAKFREGAMVTRQLIYGCLFDHLESAAVAEPEFLNPGCRRGKWLRVDERATHFPPETKYEIIPKRLWPVPLALLKGVTLEKWSPSEEIERCLMLRIDGGSAPHFITPRGYPKR